MSSIITPEFRASYPFVFVAQKNKRTDGTEVQEYSVTALFAKNADLSTMRKQAEAVLVEEFGADKTKWPKNIRSPFRKCEERWKNEGGKQTIPAGYEDGEAIFMTFKQNAEKGKPSVVDAQVQDIIEPKEIYAGCYLRASVRPYYYDFKGNRGVAFGLNNVQKLKDGEPLGGRTRATDDFEAVAEDMSKESAGSIFG